MAGRKRTAALPVRLAAYWDHLLTPLTSASVKSHLSSIWRIYKTLVESVEHRAALVAYLDHQDFATIKAKSDELDLRLARATDPERSPVKAVTVQDEADSTHIRLTPAQGAALMMRRAANNLEWVAMLLLSLDFPVESKQPDALRSILRRVADTTNRIADVQTG